MSNALSTQIDGNHYKNQKIQPIELAYLVGGTPCFTKLAKYVTRDKGDRMINLDKAIHCINIEKELSEKSLFHILSRYPSLKTDEFLDQAHMLIDLFSEDQHIRSALKYMMRQDYRQAVAEVEKLKEKLNGE